MWVVTSGPKVGGKEEEEEEEEEEVVEVEGWLIASEEAENEQIKTSCPSSLFFGFNLHFRFFYFISSLWRPIELSCF